VPKERLRWIEYKTLKNLETWTCGPNEEAQVVAGAVNHTTGTASALSLQDHAGTTITRFSDIKSGASTGWYVINPITVQTLCCNAELMSDSRGIWWLRPARLIFMGAGEVRLWIQVRKIDPQTGEDRT